MSKLSVMVLAILLGADGLSAQNRKLTLVEHHDSAQSKGRVF